MSCHESLLREFLENWVMFGQNTNKEGHKVFIRACKPGCRGTDHRWRGVQCRPTGCDARGRSRDWGGEGCNCRDKYYDPCQHPFIVGDYHIYIYHVFYNSTTHFLQLQNFVFTVLIMMRDVQMLIRAQHCCLKTVCWHARNASRLH